MRDKYNLNTLPPNLAGLEEYEMDDHVVIPGMGGMNEERQDYGDQPSLNEPPPALGSNIAPDAILRENAVIPGLDLDVSTVRDKKIPQKSTRSFQPLIERNEEEIYGMTAHDSGSILTCVRDIVSKMIESMPGIVRLDDLKPEKIQVYGKEIDVCRKF